MLKDFVVALSLANLTFTTIWQEIFNDFYDNGYFYNNAAEINVLNAVMLNVLLLTVILWGGIRLVRKSTSSIAQIAGSTVFAALVIISLNGVATLFFSSLWPRSVLNLFGKVGFIAIVITLCGFALYAVVFARRHLIRAAATGLVVLSPFAVIQFAKAGWLWHEHKGTVAFVRDRPLARALPAKDKGSPRIVWIVFDEFDYRLGFIERPVSLQLPELDRLRAQSIEANCVFSTGVQTVQVMPSLITGRVIAKTETVRWDELLVTFRDGERTVGWSSLRNIFSEARAAGFNTGLAGWLHPYCRVIGDDLTACSSQLYSYKHLSLLEAMLDQAADLLPKTIPLLYRLSYIRNQDIREYKRVHLGLYRDIMPVAKELAMDPNLGLILIHLPVPHPPAIYDRREHTFSTEPNGNYTDNLELADRTLAELRHAMEQKRLWNASIVLVTSDHPWRPEYWKQQAIWTQDEEALIAKMQTPDGRVPYLLKLPDQKHAVRYDRSFSAVLTHDLLLALLRGEITSVHGVVTWLDQHRSIGEKASDARKVTECYPKNSS